MKFSETIPIVTVSLTKFGSTLERDLWACLKGIALVALIETARHTHCWWHHFWQGPVLYKIE